MRGHLVRRGARIALALSLTLLSLSLLAAASAAPAERSRAAAPAASTSAGSAASPVLQLVGQSDLGGAGLNGEVAVVGNTAIVGAGLAPAGGLHVHMYSPYSCPAISVKLVDLSNPSTPSVVGQIPVPAGVAALDVDAMRVNTSSFQGVLGAVALQSCGAAGGSQERGVAYYDITNPASPQFLGRYMADAQLANPANPPCGGTASSTKCAQSEHSVQLVARADGRILSLSTQPSSTPSNYPALGGEGDYRIVDVTDPRAPREMDADLPRMDQFPGYGTANASVFSHNGCRPFDAGHSWEAAPGGTLGLMPYYDHGLWTVDMSDPENPVLVGNSAYDRDNRAVEGNAAYVTSATAAGRQLALVSEEDWVGVETRLNVLAPSTLAGQKFACEAMFTLFDPQMDAQIWRKAGGQVSGQIAYVGRGCPAAGTRPADPYLTPEGEIAGKIVLADRFNDPQRQPSLTGVCGFADRVARAQQLGATGVIFAAMTRASTLQPGRDTPAQEAFSPDGVPRALGIEFTIPAVMIDRDDANGLRDYLCPVSGTFSGCTAPATPASGTLVDSRGRWGGLRVVDVTDPAAPALRAEFRTENAEGFPPADLGVYSVHHAVADRGRAYVAWNSDGVRVLDLTTETPTEIGHFVPPDTADPTANLPTKAYVTGVAVTQSHVVITDVNSGLYVLARPAQSRECTITGTAGDDNLVGTAERDVICGLGGDDRIEGKGGNDLLYGDSGGDTILGGVGDDRIIGGSGGDYARGGTGKDRIDGNGGGDRLEGDASADRISGGDGGDFIRGWAGNDRLNGGRGRDAIAGMAGNDLILARDRAVDTIDGGAGRDRAIVDNRRRLKDRLKSVERRG